MSQRDPDVSDRRKMTRNCLEIDREYQGMFRCYARRFLSDDSFADFAVDSVKDTALLANLGL